MIQKASPLYLMSTYKISDSPLLKPSGKMLLNDKYYKQYFVCIPQTFSSSLGIIALSVHSPTERKVSLGSGSTIVLNCSFEKEHTHVITSVTWSKKIESEDKYTPKVTCYSSVFVYVDNDLTLSHSMPVPAAQF